MGHTLDKLRRALMTYDEESHARSGPMVPRAIYLGHTEYDSLRDDAIAMQYLKPGRAGERSFRGIPVYIVCTESHFQII